MKRPFPRIPRRTAAIAASILFPLCAAAAVLCRGAIASLAAGFPRCPLRMLTGWWCPACGNTHSVLSLLSGNLIDALRYNVAPPLLGIILLFLFAELVCFAAGHPRRILPRTGWLWFPLLGCVLLWYLLRNLFPALLPQ